MKPRIKIPAGGSARTDTNSHIKEYYVFVSICTSYIYGVLVENRIFGRETVFRKATSSLPPPMVVENTLILRRGGGGGVYLRCLRARVIFFVWLPLSSRVWIS